jgi:hypothetical protein
MIEYSSARSSTVRAIGPIVDMIRSGLGPGRPGISPVRGTRRSVVFRPNTPQKWAGMRIDADRSVPISNGVSPDATAAAAPPLEPPGVRAVSHGLLVRPKIGLLV